MEDKTVKEQLSKIEKLTQVQYSTNEQLEQLIPFAHKLGLYDAADYLKKVIYKE